MNMRFALLCCSLIAGCGLTDTAATTAAIAAAKAKEAQAAKETQEKLLKELEQANTQAQQRLQEAEGK
jgi:ABC-type uncharacterized transport system auxiliary subunit